MQPAIPTVRPDSHLTLHYRISLVDSGVDVISTFGEKPATLTLGLGQLVEPLERCLIGLAEGQHARFDLPPDQAFGPRNPQLIRKLARDVLEQHSGAASGFAAGDVIEFPARDGQRFSGVLKQIDETSAMFDFNHPLAGQRIRFEVLILGVL